MGSGPRPPTIRPVPSRLTAEAVIHCPERGEAPASAIDASRVGEVGHLRIQRQGLVLMIDGSPAANVDAEARVQACVRDGFEYAGVLEIRDDEATVRFWQA